MATALDPSSSWSDLYSPLVDGDEIRLLVLQPRSNDNIINCTIKHAKLSANSEYEALSYMWGPKDTKLIKIDDIDVHIRENLWAAMQHLSPVTGTRIMWIDSLCINQKNNNERSHQVVQMDKIYGQATNVIIWLGVSDPTSTIAFQILSDPRQWTGLNGSLVDFADKMRTMHRFFLRAYWTRLWIIQEILLAKRISVHCSSDSCSWFRISWFLNTVEKLPSLLRKIEAKSTNVEEVATAISATVPARLFHQRGYGLFEIDDHPETSQYQRPLLSLCLQFAQADCEELRDKIFALRSLASRCCREATEVDYSIMLSTLCRAVLRHYVFCHLGHSVYYKNGFYEIPGSMGSMCKDLPKDALCGSVSN